MSDTEVKKSVDNVKIYRVYMDLISYIEMITNKYPSYAKNSFVSI